MKKWFMFLVLPLLCQAGIQEDRCEGPGQADDITEEWLLGEGSVPHDTHHIALFKKIFKAKKIKTLLEFGLGYSTKYFLDRCNKVISVEVITHGYGPEVMKKFLAIYSDYSNWIPISFFSGYLGWDYSWAPYKYLGSESVYKASSYQHAYHKNYAKIDDFYLIELNAFITNLMKYNKVDLAFIGHATFLRGDIVQCLFNKTPIIVAHDSNGRRNGEVDDAYGLSRVATPENYEEIFFPLREGTTAWIVKKDETKELIEELKRYAQSI